MNNLIFIGTLHKNYTKVDELLGIIQSFSPKRVFVEMLQQDIDNDNIDAYPPEMIAVFEWSKTNHIAACGFDSDIDTTKSSATKADYDQLGSEQHDIISQSDWKAFNQPAEEGKLRTATWQKVIDLNLWDKRELEMSNNIKENLNNNEASVVVTGAGHIPFFRRMFPTARFPFA